MERISKKILEEVTYGRNSYASYRIDALLKMEIRKGYVSLSEKKILLVILIRLLQNIQISFNKQMN